VHGYLTAVCFALLLPLSVVLARGFKEYNPSWFHLHRVIGAVAWIGGARGSMNYICICQRSRRR